MKELLPAHAGTRLAAAPVAILRRFGSDRPRGGMEVKRRTARQAATLIAALTVMAAITQGHRVRLCRTRPPGLLRAIPSEPS